MLIARTRAELEAGLQTRPGRRALVPTMGALHAGHLSLIAAARAAADTVAASIFVNPLQFGQPDDLARYPRDEAGDLAKLRDAGCDLVWMPNVATMYPPDDATTVDVAGPAMRWEGTARPGHFRGVATVVAKLFGQVRPDLAVFGEKDWQQLQVIRRMQQDLGLSVRILGVPTIREADGLALSSRNRFLTPAERAKAPQLYAVLKDLSERLVRGIPAEADLARGSGRLAASGLDVDYLELVDGAQLRPISMTQAGARLIAAARLGTVRLLDNVAAG